MPGPRKPLDLRRQKPPTPPPPARPNPGPGPLEPGMLDPGTVIDPRYITADERQQLEAIGWQPGERIPGNAPDIIRAAQQEATVGGPLPLDPTRPPLTIPEPIDISRLPRQKQEEIRRSLEWAAQQIEEQRAFQEETAGLPSGVAEAVRVAEQTTRPAGGVTVVDDRPSPPPPHGPAPRAAQPPGQSPPPPPPPPQPGPRRATPPPGDLTPTGAAGLTHCPHCSWDLKRPDLTEPDLTDKRAFLAAALAWPPRRFTREYPLLDGQARLGLRSLTSHEADTALVQVGIDYRTGTVVGDGEWWQRLMDYRMAQAIDYLDIDRVGRVYEGQELADILYDTEGKPRGWTAYPGLRDHILTEVLPGESLHRVVGQTFMAFQRLADKLEANAGNRDFWTGIGSAP